ncbi:diacylglycerol kinase family protein [Cesiribacter sp. SM1]|uniref:diacylglycerol/lipid kinase family protein n=1 Tax=Cesiribacter sp. SM1 TaxID=2861196 RepID=UPI001CD44C8D|nr:diacylglycerol kinase family protein [Cesiribacter sp. SM1]
MALHVTVLHNGGAGFEQISREELLEALQTKGFKTTYIDIQEEGFSLKLEIPGELVVIAGGDGTLRRISKYLIGKSIPIGLLPMGTANNIATNLGISGMPASIIAAWDLSKRKPFSIGVVKGIKEESFFLESVGFGLFPRLIRQRIDKGNDAITRGEELDNALRHQLEILKEYNAHYCVIDLDGQRVSGRFILVEVMNIQYSGPNLNMAPHANPEDTYLDIVMVREDEREIVGTYLEDRIKSRGTLKQLPVRRAQHVKVEWYGIHCHIDDEAYELPSPIKLEINVLQNGLEFLAV